MNVKIKDIPISDRPRERLMSNSPDQLSNEELLAIILSSGTKNYSSKVLADILLKETGGINNLQNINLKQLLNIKGIGKAKACILLASIELGKRMNNELSTLNNLKFKNSETVFKYFKNKLINKKQEHFYCLYLDNNNKIINEKLLFIGTLNQSIVHPREIFKEAYLLSASAIICIHNHPSGNVKPSDNDLNITYKLQEIGKLLGIKIIDHIIIGKDKYYSFFENNQL